MAAKRKTASATSDPMVHVALERWRKSREPADADAVEEVGKRDLVWDKRIARIASTRGGSDVVVARMKSTHELEDDPRLTRVILGWLASARWPGIGAAEGWRSLFERLVTLRDARAIAPLCQMAKDLPPFLGTKHRAFMAAEIAKTADAIEHATPKIRVSRPIVLKKPGAAADAMAIVQRVFDAPHDDDLRRVVADELLELGEPWGEFIQLGFLIEQGVATAEQRAAADGLLKKHPATFGGPLMKIARTDSREFKKGFVWRISTNASMVPRPAWEAAAKTPYWGTVTRLELDMSTTPKWWIAALFDNPALRSLREVHINWNRERRISVVREDLSTSWRVVSASGLNALTIRALREFVMHLPAAERERLEIAPIPERDEIVQALLDRR